MLDETSELRRQLFAELRPQGIIETALADEILIALLRLRRCAQSESGADPDQKHIDRERTQAHGLLLRSNAELRRLRKDRTASEHIPEADVAVSAPAPTPELPASEPASIPRSAPCPCGSGLKYKRCHGWNAPASPRSASTSRTHHPSEVPPHVQASPPSGSPTC